MAEAMATYLTPHFSLEELTQTSHREFDNTPPPEAVEALRDYLAPGMEKVRTILGNKVISVNSGYRSPAVNNAVGGVVHSAHLYGYACDFNCFGFGAPIDVCRAIVKSGLKFDQIIEEGTWVHISFDPKLRGDVLTKSQNGSKAYVLGLR